MAGSADISRDRRHRASDASESFGEAAFVRTESTEHGPYYPFPQASNVSEAFLTAQPSPSQVREQEHRLEDDLAMLERLRGSFQIRTRLCSLPPLCASHGRGGQTTLMSSMPIRTLSTRRLQVTPPPAHPASNLAKVLKRIHDSSFIVRYFMYIIPVSALLSVPLLVGTLAYGTDAKSVGGVQLLWFSVWLEIVWLTLWASRIAAKTIPWPLGLVCTLFTNNSKKWRDMGKQLELPITLFFWWLGIEISFLPTMKNHMIPNYAGDTTWMATVNQIIVSVFVGAVLNLVEKVIIQLIAISFHLRTYSDRIEMNKFQIGSLVKLYDYSKRNIAMEDSDFEDTLPISGPGSGARTPMQYVEKARRDFTSGFRKVGDVAGKVAGDFTGRQVTTSTHPHQVVLVLLNSTQGAQVLARRLYRTFLREDRETVSADDVKPAFDREDEADAAFSMFDRDLNGDISMEELESVCVEIGRERKSITASLKDLDSVVSKLDAILLFIVVCVTILVFITLISTSAAGVLTSAGSTVLALSWLFSATAQELLQSIIFVFYKHPFDVGDRVSIYGNTGASMKGDDYFVKEISLLYTEFKKMEGHVVQASNSALNTLFILNMRRSGGLAEAVPLTVKFGTTLDQIEKLRSRLLEFVKAERREYQSNILTEIRDVVEAHSINLNVVFFYKSNWQNEGLRLQRRNKFICALMVSMQEIGIEGPLMRLPGQRSEQPFYISSPNLSLAAPHSSKDGADAGQALPSPHEQSALSSARADEAVDAHRQQSILRNSGTNSRPRFRGESASSMAKRVDFSLGMKDIASDHIMGDLYEDPPRKRVPEIAPAFPARRKTSIEGIGEGPRGISLDHNEHSTSRSRFRMRSISAASRFRPKNSPASVHSNQLLPKKSMAEGADLHSESLMERGLASPPQCSNQGSRDDSRFSIVKPQAVGTHLAGSVRGRRSSSGDSTDGVNAATENFEMGTIR